MTNEELVKLYTPLVRKIAGGFQRKLPRNVLREDIIQAGMLGLWDAIRRRPDTIDTHFEQYIRIRVRGAILDELRSEDWLPRRLRDRIDREEGTTASVSMVRFDDVSEWEQNKALKSTHQEEQVELSREVQILISVLERLPARERMIMEAHYIKGVKFTDLAKELGVSEPRISQLHSRAVARVKEWIAA